MLKTFNHSWAKKAIAMFVTMAVMFTGVLSISAYAATNVITQNTVSTVSGEPTQSFTIPDGDTKLAIAICVDIWERDPTSAHAVLQKQTLLGGWSSIAGAWIPSNGESATPWGVINVNPGETYRVYYTCTPGSSDFGVIKITTCFLSTSY